MVNPQFAGIKRVLAVLSCLFAGQLAAQAPLEHPSQEFIYEMIQGDGTNASAVAWDAQHGMYVTVIAGNAEFPLEVFDADGQPRTQVMAGADLRGLWYNAALGMLEGNGPGESGWFTCNLNEAYEPSAMNTIRSGQFQPAYNSVGAYDSDRRQVVFLDYSVDGLAMYSRKNPKKVKKLSLIFEKSDLGNINSTTVGYTGHAGFEYVLLDIERGALFFFDRSGNETAMAQLPEDAPLNDAFAFSFTHDRAFLYDIDRRVWHAYRVW
jgi:hypothetical protein